jgi:hypothetical protein
MFPTPKTQDTLKTAINSLHRGIDATVTWVTQLSWWKFLVFAVLMLIAGSILQDELFSSNPIEEEVVRSTKNPKRKPGDTNILIDDSGIHFNPRGKIRNKDADKPESNGEENPVAAPERFPAKRSTSTCRRKLARNSPTPSKRPSMTPPNRKSPAITARPPPGSAASSSCWSWHCLAPRR